MVTVKKFVQKLSIFIVAGVLSAFCLGWLEAAYTHPSHSYSKTHEEEISSSPSVKGSQDVLVVPPDASGRPAYYATGNLYTFLATGEETGGAFSLFDFFVPSQSVALPHIHSPEDEAFYVLEGEVTFQLASPTGIQTQVATPGSLIFLPKERPHGWLNSGTNSAKLLSLVVPGGFEGFFIDQNQPVTDKSAPIPPPLPPELLAPIAQKYGIRPASTTDFIENNSSEGLLDYLIVSPDANRPSFNAANSQFTFLATSEETGSQFSLFDISLPPQIRPRLLRLLPNTPNVANSFYVLEGEVTFQIENKTIAAAPGTFIYVPRGTQYAFQNNGKAQARMLSLITPTLVPESSAS
jgi:quercetin dioxygenase-like cupin family protein